MIRSTVKGKLFLGKMKRRALEKRSRELYGRGATIKETMQTRDND